MKGITSDTTVEVLYLNDKGSTVNDVQNIYITIQKRSLHHYRQRKKNKHAQDQMTDNPATNRRANDMNSRSTVSVLWNTNKKVRLKTTSSATVAKKSTNPYHSKFVTNVAEVKQPECLNPFTNPLAQVKWRVYRCQLSTADESCCCSCNSDAMFEVMKSLYDCYKKKNCDNCNCILCGHLPREERKLGEMRKSGVASIGVAVGEKETEKKKAKAKKAEKEMVGKTPEEKEKILKELALSGGPLPEAKTASEKELIKKVKTQLGLPQKPKTAAEKEKMKKAEAAGLVIPLEGKTASQKEQILQQQAKAGIPLPEGRTTSEKAIIQKVKTAMAVPQKVPSEKLKKAKAEGFLTPLEGKTPEQKEKILRGLVMNGIPLPEGKTASEKNIIDKVRADLGLPPKPRTSATKAKYKQVEAAGFLTPLEGKNAAQKEKILKAQAGMGLPLPEGRTPSEKALIAKVKAETKPLSKGVPSEKLRKAKEAGLLTPLEGKTPAQKEKILRGLATSGMPLPEGKTASEKKLIDKVRTEVGLPPEPKTESAKKKYQQATVAGIITPLEGKSKAQKEKILKGQVEMGLPLPEGRTQSEKALIAKVKAETKKAPSEKLSKASALAVPSEKLRKAKAAGFLTPLEGKSPEQKEKILRGLVMNGIPLPEGKTKSEKKLVDKVRVDMGLPPGPKSATEKKKYQEAIAAGIVTPLEGKSAGQKEKILRRQAEAGLPLPEGRTPSEKAMIAKVKATAKQPAEEIVSKKGTPSEKLQKAKAAGFLTPLEGKSPEQKEKILRGLVMNGIPLPEGKTKSEKKIVDKVRVDMGLPPEPKNATEKKKYQEAIAAGIVTPLEGKSAGQKEKILRRQAEAGLPLPEGRTPSEKAMIAKVKATAKQPAEEIVSKKGTPSEKLQKAKAAGFLTPLEGKSPEQKEKILRGLVMNGIPLPEGKTKSEKKIVDKVRVDMGLPPEPKNATEKKKYQEAIAAGIVTPLEGKSAGQKEKILRRQAEAGLPLPEGRTRSEKAIIAKVKATAKPPAEELVSKKGTPSEKLRKAKAAGLVTPLEGKTPEEKEKAGTRTKSKATAARTPALLPEKLKILDQKTAKVMKEGKGPSDECICGILTPESEKVSVGKAVAFKTPSQKEKIQTPSEKLRKATVGAAPPSVSKEKISVGKIPSEKLRKAKAAGLLTPLTGKSPEQREKILKGLAKQGVPLPEGKSASEKQIIDKVRADLGLPPEPKTSSMKQKYAKAQAQGIMTPLDGKTAPQKENILKAQAKAGIPLPEGRTPSEKALINKIKAAVGAAPPSVSSEKAPVGKIPSEKFKKAKAAGLLTPLTGKSPEQREKILKGLAKQGIPLPEGKTASEKKIIDKVRADLGLPPEPKTSSMKQKYAKAQAQGIITPLDGKTGPQKENILKAQAQAGIPLPEGRTPSEKALIDKIRTAVGAAPPSAGVPSEVLKKAKAAGLMTPLEGKTPSQKEKIIKGRIAAGIPLPEAKTASEKELFKKVKAETGYVSPLGKTPSEKMRKAKAAGLVTPLEGKTPAQKEKIIRGLTRQGLPLPEGKTPSHKALIDKIKAESARPSKMSSAKMKEAKAAGLLTPLKGKSPEQREKILKGLVKSHLPLPEGKTDSEKKIIQKVRDEMGLPPEPKTPSIKEKYYKALAGGIITPMEGKTPAQKENILRKMHEAGIQLPEGRTPSEKSIVRRVKAGAPPAKVPSEKMRAAKAAGLLTPLEGKTPAQKEKIIRGLAKSGVPLPEGKTASEKAVISKIQAEVGVKPSKKGPPTPLSEKAKKLDQKTAKVIKEGKGPSDECICGILTPDSEKFSVKVGRPSKLSAAKKQPSEKIKKAKAAGLQTPLEGKSPVQAEPRGIPSEKVPSEKLRKAKAAGLLTPLEGKTAAEKKKILDGLAEAGIPLPEGKTPSDKAMVQKVKTEYGIPKAVTPSEKEIIRKAKTEGLLTPLAGKTAAQKEKILKGLADAGLPMPEGKTASEKQLIKKVRTAAGLPPEATPSEKLGKVKTKSKKVGATSRKSVKGVGAAKSKAGILEEFQDIIKTTVCDRACGCDKKKIRFKHSYVKIRVTSPDISSLCPCPNECLPGVKGGVFTDNEGIKVTVGSAVGFPLFSKDNQSRNENISYTNDNYSTESSKDNYWLNEENPRTSTDDVDVTYKYINIKAKYSGDSLSSYITNTDPSTYQEIFHQVNQLEHKSNISNSSSSRYLIACSESYTTPSLDSLALEEGLLNIASRSSFDSKMVVKTESSLSFASNSTASIDIISIISYNDGNITSTSSHYLCCEQSKSTNSLYAEDSEYFTKITDYSALDTVVSDTDEHSAQVHTVSSKTNKTESNIKNNDTFIYRMSNTNKSHSEKHKTNPNNNHRGKPIIIINELNSEKDILKMVNEILAKEEMKTSSSIFVVIPTSDEYDTDVSDSASSTICIRISENYFNWKHSLPKGDGKYLHSSKSTTQGLKISTKGKPSNKSALCEVETETVAEKVTETLFQKKKDDKNCQVDNIGDVMMDRCHYQVSTDTTLDRPCCCPPLEPRPSHNYGSHEQCVANVVSDLITPIIVSQSIAQGLCKDTYLNVPGINITGHKALLLPNQATSVSVCNIPPCAGQKQCHEPDTPDLFDTIGKNFPMNHKGLKDLSPGDSCKCNAANVQRTQPKAIQSRGCGGPIECRGPANSNNRPTPIRRIKEDVGEHQCSSCCRLTKKDDKKMSCLCSGKEKKVNLQNACVCEDYNRPPPASTAVGPGTVCTRSVGEQCCPCDDTKPKTTPTNKSCSCNEDSKRGKKKKNIICECPEEEPEEDLFDYLDIPIDEKENRKMRSDMTQTTSGFKIGFKKRLPLQETMSFEEALEYFEKHPLEGDSTQVDDSCYCENGKPPKKKTTDCECPEEIEEDLPIPEVAPLKGLKIHIGGKGSGSKGLTGICCFDMIQEF